MTSRETIGSVLYRRMPASRSGRRGGERLVDLGGGDLAAEHDREVGQRPVLDRDPEGHAVQLPGHLGDDQPGGPGRAGGGRHDVDRRRPGAAQVLVRPVQQHLVAGVGVDRGHEAALDAERVVQHLHHRRHAVGGARRVGDHVVPLRVVVAVVDARARWSASTPLPGAEISTLRAPPFRCSGRAVAGAELAGRLDDDVGAELAPVDLGRVPLGQHRDRRAVDGRSSPPCAPRSGRAGRRWSRTPAGAPASRRR